VASTTTKNYFFNIAGGDLVIPDDALYGAHDANWTRFGMDSVKPETRREILAASEWTNVFFVKHVLERFISGYLDKVVHDCAETYDPSFAINHYHQYGFSCEKHKDLEAFVSFMETVPKMEGHFDSQTFCCNPQKIPYTDIIYADNTMSAHLEQLSKKLGVEHPHENNRTSNHATGAKDKMVDLFKGKKELIPRILNMFQEDCHMFPKLCDVEDLISAVEE
jgi:hypothetical protein